jgi:hypothetical protein
MENNEMGNGHGPSGPPYLGHRSLLRIIFLADTVIQSEVFQEKVASFLKILQFTPLSASAG